MSTKNKTTAQKITTRDEWLEARKALLEKEKELTRRSDELARQRQELPWVRIDKEYTFQTDEGEKTLAELFDGRPQLMVYHFMFGPDYEAGCPTCSAAAENLEANLPHLNAKDVTMMLVSAAPLEKLRAYKQRMGWTIPWVSAHGSDFKADFGTSFSVEQLSSGFEYNFRQENFGPLLEMDAGPFVDWAAQSGTTPSGYISEMHGLTAFALQSGVVYHTYSTYARGAGFLLGFYPVLDRAPYGRNEGDPPEFWIRRKDEYNV